jgi:FkbM family methyltransferase
MFFRGEYEPTATQFLRRVATPGWSVVDVGANVGYFSVLAADLGGPSSRVLAFEPHPRLAGMLELTARHNPGDICVQVAACGSESGTARLYVSPEDRNSGLGSLRSDLHDTKSVEVSVLRLDDCCQERNLRPDLVKIDAEGYELEVLRGCGDLLERRVPRNFLIELSPQREDPARVIALLAGHGYAASQIRSDGSLQPVEKIADAYEDVCFRRV